MADPAARPLRVLVVEDNPDTRGSLCILLRVWGHTCDCVVDGPRGFALARTFHLDVALLDIGLSGLNGYDLARSLIAGFGPDRLRLIALTGYGTEQDRARGQAAGFHAHLLKPYDPTAIEHLLAVWQAKFSLG